MGEYVRGFPLLGDVRSIQPIILQIENTEGGLPNFGFSLSLDSSAAIRVRTKFVAEQKQTRQSTVMSKVHYFHTTFHVLFNLLIHSPRFNPNFPPLKELFLKHQINRISLQYSLQSQDTFLLPLPHI